MAAEKRIRPNDCNQTGRRRATTRHDYIKIPGFGFILRRELKFAIGVLVAFLVAYTFMTVGLYEIFNATGRL